MTYDNWKATEPELFEEPASCKHVGPCDCAGPRPKEKRGEELPFCPDCREPDGFHTTDCPRDRDVGF